MTNFDNDTQKLIERIAKIVSLLDVYDAFTTRDDEKSGIGLPDETVKERMKEFSDEKELIDLLYYKGIFGTKSAQ